MARFAVVWCTVAVLLCAVAGGSWLEDANPIRMVSDVEQQVIQVIGQCRSAVSFARFVGRFRKTYRNEEEMKQRYDIFSQNLRFIRSINKKRLSYTLAVNHFADWTWEEFKRHRLGAAQNCSATHKGNHKLTDAVLPPTKDWREEKIVSLVKDQGSCGSCWTFSTTGALEAAYAQAHGKSISLSEQQLVDCAGDFNNFGCNGGLPSQAFEYIKYNGGLETEEAYPYTGKDGVCKFSAENVGIQVLDSVNITLGAEDELKHAVAFVRPVSVAFQVVSGFRFYEKGVYTSDSCGSTPLDVNHAVLAVGYGVENGVPYWLIKNSWGANWGDSGYFKMELGKNMWCCNLCFLSNCGLNCVTIWSLVYHIASMRQSLEQLMPVLFVKYTGHV
ncbi:pro-cathepsin H-like isoform X2 [Phaseolus vulgaris]|uniref:pro-cathepsin H-like isoform X2 n=1 Tax=Phaseolus vulgaris TaxID=3885 RepID=UPI0035CA1482